MMEVFEKIAAELTSDVRDVFADMAFLDVMPPPEGAEMREIDGPWALIEVRGTVNGQLVLMLPLELKKALIESIYSEPWDELEGDKKDDGLLEVLNVVAGKFTSGYERTDGFLKLTIPTVIFGTDDLPDKAPEVDLIQDAEGTLFRIQFFASEAR